VDFDRAELEAVLPAIRHWARTHETPDAALFGFASGGALSPREIARDLDDPSPLVQQFLGIVAFRVRRSSATEVAARFYGEDTGPETLVSNDLPPQAQV
jgi:hypothetical protein